jgi:hypothetical protein
MGALFRDRHAQNISRIRPSLIRIEGGSTRKSGIGLAAVLALGMSGAGAADADCNRECLAGVTNAYQIEAVLTAVPCQMESGW